MHENKNDKEKENLQVVLKSSKSTVCIKNITLIEKNLHLIQAAFELI